MMVSLVEMMIENHIDLFDVPAHVQLPARRYLKKKRGGEVSLSPIPVCAYITYARTHTHTHTHAHTNTHTPQVVHN